MALSAEELLALERLAALRLDEEERRTIVPQLDRVLAWMRRLDALDDEDLEATCHPLGCEPRLREDEVEPSLPVEDALRQAPAAREGLFLTPPVLEEKEGAP